MKSINHNIRRSIILKHLGYWCIVWVIQSILFGVKGDFEFYFVKNIFLVTLESMVFYINTLFLIPQLFSKSRYIFYILSALITVYFAYLLTWPFLNLMFSLIYPDMVYINNSGNNWIPPFDFWRILSGSVFYFLSLFAGTIIHLMIREDSKDKIPKERKPSIPQNEAISVKEGKVTHKLLSDEIYFIEGMREYVKWHTRSRQLITLNSLAGLATSLENKGFIRIHKSYIVNYRLISSISHNHIMIKDQKVPIGRSYRKNIKPQLKPSDI